MLESQGIVPDYVVGTSAGAVVGSLYAGGNDAFAMQKIAASSTRRSSPTGRWADAAFSRARPCRISSTSTCNKRPLEKLNKPFATVATDLKTGERVVFRTGDTGLAVRASAAVPGIFQPTQFRGRTYVDGGLTSPVPVQAARDMGADFVIAVDISDRPEGQPVDSLTAIIWQTTTIMGGVIGTQRTARSRHRHSPHPALRQILGFHGPPRRHAGRRKSGTGGAAAHPAKAGPLKHVRRPGPAPARPLAHPADDAAQHALPVDRLPDRLPAFARHRRGAGRHCAGAGARTVFARRPARNPRAWSNAMPEASARPALHGFDEQLRPLPRHHHPGRRLPAGARPVDRPPHRRPQFPARGAALRVARRLYRRRRRRSAGLGLRRARHAGPGAAPGHALPRTTSPTCCARRSIRASSSSATPNRWRAASRPSSRWPSALAAPPTLVDSDPRKTDHFGR